MEGKRFKIHTSVVATALLAAIFVVCLFKPGLNKEPISGVLTLQNGGLARRPMIHLIRTCRYNMEDGRFGEISNELAEGYVDAFSHGFGQKLDTRCPFSIWKVDSVYVSISVEP